MPTISEMCLNIMTKVSSRLRDEIAQTTRKKGLNSQERLEISKHLDDLAETTITQSLVLSGLSFAMISEDSSDKTYGLSPSHIVILDPIDGTDLAVRGLPGAVSSMVILDYDTQQPIFSILSDLMMHKIYHASSNVEGAFCNGERVFPSQTDRLKDATISVFAPRSDRLLALSSHHKLIESTYRIHNTGGSLAVAQVGAGALDAVAEFTKGFRNIDYGAAIFFAQKAGAFVSDLEGQPVKIHIDKQIRQKFIVAATESIFYQLTELAHESH